MTDKLKETVERKAWREPVPGSVSFGYICSNPLFPRAIRAALSSVREKDRGNYLSSDKES